MNRVRLFLPLLCLAALLGVGPAAAAGDVNIGFVNTGRVLEQAPQMKAASDRLEREFAPRNAEITEAQDELKKLEDRLTRDGPVMSEEERRKLERERLAQQRELKRSREAFTEDLNIRRNEMLSRFQKLVQEVIVNLAEAEGYDLIFETGVVYAADRVDVTEAVLQRLQKRFEDEQSAQGQ